MKKKILVSLLLLVISFGTVWANERSAANRLPAPTQHNILSNQLPRALLADIKRDYKNYWISELYEEGGDKQPSYFITLESADQIIKLNATGSENWVITNTILKT